MFDLAIFQVFKLKIRVIGGYDLLVLSARLVALSLHTSHYFKSLHLFYAIRNIKGIDGFPLINCVLNQIKPTVNW